MLFDDAVWKDERNNNIHAAGDILHRAFCVDCFQPIRGLRIKCTHASCRYSDRCAHCDRVLVQGSETHSHNSCTQHIRIQIPSPERLAMLRSPQQIQNH